jgi:hypothetical protein
MTVYIDDVRHVWRGMVFCHCWADSEKELLAFVDVIGVQRKWIQGHTTRSIGKAKKASWVHFDIALSKRKLALKHGAVLTDKYGPVEFVARLALKEAKRRGDQKGIDRAWDRLCLVASCRGERLKIERFAECR